MSRPNFSFRRSSTLAKPYSSSLQSALASLDWLINWEKRHFKGQGVLLRPKRFDSNPCRRILSRLGNPQSQFTSIHITGSKGKGTVSALIAAALQRPPFASASGRPPVVGIYSSPHVEHVNERIRIGGVPIDDDALAAHIGAALEARGSNPLLEYATWFDVLTASGMLAFREAGVTHAVVEVGVGGRLDATNVLDAPLSVITNIHLEHTNIIGPTLSDIAREKAGVIAPGAVVLLGVGRDDRGLADIFLQEAESKMPAASVRFVQPPAKGEPIFHANLRLARAAVAALAEREGCPVTDPAVLLPESAARDALAQLPARQERFLARWRGRPPLPSPAARAAKGSGDGGGDVVHVLLDGAHVGASVALVMDEASEAGFRMPVVVLALGIDKDAAAICMAVARRARAVLATQAGDCERYRTAHETARALAEAGCADVETIVEAEDAVLAAVERAGRDGVGVVVIGSLHLAGRVRPQLRRLAGEVDVEPETDAGGQSS